METFLCFWVTNEPLLATIANFGLIGNKIKPSTKLMVRPELIYEMNLTNSIHFCCCCCLLIIIAINYIIIFFRQASIIRAEIKKIQTSQNNPKIINKFGQIQLTQYFAFKKFNQFLFYEIFKIYTLWQTCCDAVKVYWIKYWNTNGSIFINYLE